MKSKPVITRISKKNIVAIKPLWEKLNNYHLAKTIHFQEHFETFTFEERVKSFTSLDEACILIETAVIDQHPIGYCISTINVEERRGEVESLYIEEDFRKTGIGEKLITRGISWFKKEGCEKICVSVAAGNEEAFPFYEKFGFRRRSTNLQIVNDLTYPV